MKVDIHISVELDTHSVEAAYYKIAHALHTCGAKWSVSDILCSEVRAIPHDAIQDIVNGWNEDCSADTQDLQPTCPHGNTRDNCIASEQCASVYLSTHPAMCNTFYPLAHAGVCANCGNTLQDHRSSVRNAYREA
jgi:hypothetical protein